MLFLLLYLVLLMVDFCMCSVYTFDTLPHTTDFCKYKCGLKLNVCCLYGFEFGPSCLTRPTVLDIQRWEKEAILVAFNTMRNKIASGDASRIDLKGMTASNMNAMSYSRELAFTASCWARQCKPNHSRCRSIDKGLLGETTCWGKAFSRKLDDQSAYLLTQCPNYFIASFSNLTTSVIDSFVFSNIGDDERNRETIQLIWATTQFIGCSRIAFPHEERGFNTILLVCHYYPKANIVGEPVFKRGKPCSECGSQGCNPMYANLCGNIRDIKDDNWIPPLTKSGDSRSLMQFLKLAFVLILQVAIKNYP